MQHCEEGLEIANPVKRILLTWTVQAALHVFSSSTNLLVTLSTGELDTMSKYNLSGPEYLG